jgi:hypothetical protein
MTLHDVQVKNLHFSNITAILPPTVKRKLMQYKNEFYSSLQMEKQCEVNQIQPRLKVRSLSLRKRGRI